MTATFAAEKLRTACGAVATDVECAGDCDVQGSPYSTTCWHCGGPVVPRSVSPRDSREANSKAVKAVFASSG